MAKKIVLISSGLLNPKKENTSINRQNLYPNYGLVSLATVLKRKGYDPIVINVDYEEPQTIFDIITSFFDGSFKYPILLSIPSFFAIDWAINLCKIVYDHFGDGKIVVGGKWVVSGNEEWLRSKLLGVRKFISTNAEGIIEDIVEDRSINIENESMFIPNYLDYTTIYDFRKYQPSIEIGRGCGNGCKFCLEKNVKYRVLCSPKNAASSLNRLMIDYDSDQITPYFQTSLFRPSNEWCLNFSKHYKNFDLSIKWRTQTRVDLLTERKIENLAKSGLKVLDLGLESASYKQIYLMNKSKNPSKYLSQASKFLHLCHKYGIWVKLNILLYAGENSSTLSETCDWLDAHIGLFKGLSVNPLYIYRYKDYLDFIKSISLSGASLVENNSIEKYGYAKIHYSKDFNYWKGLESLMKIKQKYLSMRDYYDLKSFSYYDRFYTFENFCSDIKSIDQLKLPFRI